jgi:hypothetical protein
VAAQGKTKKKSGFTSEMDALGIEPNTSRKPYQMLSERDNQLHHVPIELPGVQNYSSVSFNDTYLTILSRNLFRFRGTSL